MNEIYQVTDIYGVFENAAHLFTYVNENAAPNSKVSWQYCYQPSDNYSHLLKFKVKRAQKSITKAVFEI